MGDVIFYITERYFYSDSALKVEPNVFKNWNYANFNQYINTTNSLYLKSIYETKYDETKTFGTMTFEAVKIYPMKLEAEFFDFKDFPKKPLVF